MDVDVLALIDHFALGGAETLLSRFAEVAPRAGIRLSIVCLEDRGGNPAAEPLVARGMPPTNLNLPGRPDLDALLKVRRHISQARPQIVHTHLGTSDIVGGLTARSLGVPMISTIHATEWPRRSPTYYGKRMLVRLCASRVVAVSESARRTYLERGWAAADQIVTIPNGIDVAPAPGSGADVRRELGLMPDDFVAGMVSALRPEKGHDVAIAAIELLRDRFPRLRLVIAGDGPSARDIASRAEALGGIAVMAGRRSDVMRVFDALDVCLHPSRADAFPTTLIEAMAAGVPVLATGVGGIPEIIVDGRTGVLIPTPTPELIASGLAGLIGNGALRQSLAGAARREYDDRFTADPWVRRTRALYDEVLATRYRSRRYRLGSPGSPAKAQASSD